VPGGDRGGRTGRGKTGLLWEFENCWTRCPSHGAISRHFHARASHEMQATPYSLLRDLFVLRFDIQDSDPAPAARAKLEQGIGRVLGQTNRDG